MIVDRSTLSHQRLFWTEPVTNCESISSDWWRIYDDTGASTVTQPHKAFEEQTHKFFLGLTHNHQTIEEDWKLIVRHNTPNDSNHNHHYHLERYGATQQLDPCQTLKKDNNLADDDVNRLGT